MLHKDGDLTVDLMDAVKDSKEVLTVLVASTIDAPRTDPTEATMVPWTDARKTDQAEAHTVSVQSGEVKIDA